MKSKIRVLPPDIVSKIAAGEIIERPASVVKELVENSLDAGSGVITVEIEEGGKKRITVMDDGEGMVKEDAFLALERHATSKIYDEKDLNILGTLGFRGEALSSIAAVSCVSLITRAHDEISGTRILVEDGRVQGAEEIGCPPGTRLEIKDLFYNVPARQKFLRGVQTEMAHIIEVITRMALVHSSVGFILKHNNRVVFNLPSTQEERSRIRAILGKEVTTQLVRVEASNGFGVVQGWATVPTYIRGSSKGIYIYVNGRYIRDKLIFHAVSEAYRRFIPARMYPVTILSLSIPFSEVDVNVHPAKMEVRFRRGEELHRLICDSLKDALSHFPTIKSYEASEIREEMAPYSAPSSLAIGTERISSSPPLWRMTGQLKGTYLVIEGEEGVMIIDQHAAHERILYERLKKALEGEKISQQPFLIPQPIEVKKDEKELLVGYRFELARVGLEIEEFGERAVSVTSIPSFLQGEDLQSLLEALSEELAERGEGGAFDRVLDRLCVLLACRGAVKANHRLQEEEVNSLLREWEEAGQPTTCPHGRPLLITWSWREVEGWFRRS
ncbi:MAG: DNA mismatch repair endonuclease MutL [Deltaproteobacteria bacterium]|nr:DNA mismatch repair endonuclease MutL [Deltaproteobacteria bacterium]